MAPKIGDGKPVTAVENALQKFYAAGEGGQEKLQLSDLHEILTGSNGQVQVWTPANAEALANTVESQWVAKFSSHEEALKLRNFLGAVKDYLNHRADVLGFENAAISSEVLEALYAANNKWVKAPDGSGWTTSNPQPTESVAAALGTKLNDFIQAYEANPGVAKGVLRKLAEDVQIPKGDSGFAVAASLLLDFGVSPLEAGVMKSWLDARGKNRVGSLVPRTDGAKLVEFVEVFTKKRGSRAFKPEQSKDASAVHTLIDQLFKKTKQSVSTGNQIHYNLALLEDARFESSRKEKKPEKTLFLSADLASPKKGDKNAAGLSTRRRENVENLFLGDQGPTRRAEMKAYGRAILNDTGELLVLKDTLIPDHVAHDLDPAKAKELNEEIDRKLGAIQVPKEFDTPTADLYKLETLQNEFGDDFQKVASSDPEAAYKILAKRMLLAERRRPIMKELVNQLNLELAAKDHPLHKMLLSNNNGAAVDGIDVLTMYTFYDVAVPNVESNDPEIIKFLRDSRKKAVSFWAGNENSLDGRTTNLDKLKELAKDLLRKAPTGAWGTSKIPKAIGKDGKVTDTLPDEDKKRIIMSILTEQCGAKIPENFDPSKDLSGYVIIDSVQFLELAVAVEHQFGVKVRTADEGNTKLRSINKILEEIKLVEQSDLRRPWMGTQPAKP